MGDEAKTDSEKLSKILEHLDSANTKMDAFGKRMDAMEAKADAGARRLDEACSRMDGFEKVHKDAESKKADAEEKEKADKTKADAEEKEKADKAKADAEEKEKADKAKADAAEQERKDSVRLQTQIDELVKRVPPSLTPEVRQRLVGFQSKAERVAQAFGDAAGAPSFVNGENESDYRVRLLSKYQVHSSAYKDADLGKIHDPTAFALAEDRIYSDAMAAALNPKEIAPNVLLERVTTDATGRRITRFLGAPGACWNRFKMPYRYVKGWGDPKTGKMQTVF